MTLCGFGPARVDEVVDVDQVHGHVVVEPHAGDADVAAGDEGERGEQAGEQRHRDGDADRGPEHRLASGRAGRRSRRPPGRRSRRPRSPRRPAAGWRPSRPGSGSRGRPPPRGRRPPGGPSASSTRPPDQQGREQDYPCRDVGSGEGAHGRRTGYGVGAKADLSDRQAAHWERRLPTRLMGGRYGRDLWRSGPSDSPRSRPSVRNWSSG